MKKTNKALVVGVSNYGPPLSKLPNVAADVREIAKVLQSKDGAFESSATTVLSDKQATKSAIELALRDVFEGPNCDTVFVYLAGHGAVENNGYYFIPIDANVNDLNSTAVSLSNIKLLFDNCNSERLFLWLDSCHSGGILKRAAVDDTQIVTRTLKVVQGQGRVIIAACTANQYAYEGAEHGLFTGALLNGLKGKAKSASEVTASSLFDYIDREMGSSRQRPMWFGQMTGRIVLMHYPEGTVTTTSSAKGIRKKTQPAKRNENGILLGNHYLDATRVSRTADNTFQVELLSKDAEQDAAIQSLRPSMPYRHSDPVPFAYGNDACDVKVASLTSESATGGQVWSLTLTPQESRNQAQLEFTIVDDGRQYNPEDIAALRARVILLNERREITRNTFPPLLVSQTETGPGGGPLPCIIQDVYKALKARKVKWQDVARLWAIYLLKKTGVVEHVLELTISSVRNGKIAIKFRGKRHRQYTNVEPATIEVSGNCSLSE